MTIDDLIGRATICRRGRLQPPDASPWAIAGGALILTSLRAEACFAFADRYGAALGRWKRDACSQPRRGAR